MTGSIAAGCGMQPARRLAPGSTGILPGGAWDAGTPSDPPTPAYGHRKAFGEVSLFLGAGMGVAYGMPTTAQFKGRMLRKYPQRRTWARLFEDPHLPDIEDVWAAAESFSSFAAMQGSEYWLRQLPYAEIDRHELADLLGTLESEVFDAYRWNPGNDSLLESVLGPVLSLTSSYSGGIRVFTTNYDRSVEEYCSDPSHGFRCHDGFEYDPQTGRVLWSGFARRPAFYGMDKETPLDTLNLFKIHGSLGWKASRYGPERAAHEAKAADPSYSDILIYPSGSTKPPYAGIHSDIFNGFVDGLHTSDACVVAGYSFRDGLIAEQFARFAEGGKTLIAVGPDAAASLGNVLPRAAGRARSRWAQAGAGHLVYTGGSCASVHAIQMPVLPETVRDMVAAVRHAITMPAGMAAPARGDMQRRSDGVPFRGHGATLNRHGRPMRARMWP